jgi:hypothetical protein
MSKPETISDTQRKKTMLVNHRTGERRRPYDNERVIPDDWGVEVVMNVIDAAPSNNQGTYIVNDVTVTLNDQNPATDALARRVLGDAEFFKRKQAGTYSMTRSANVAFWGTDSSRTDAEEVGLFNAIRPLLDAGVKTMVKDEGARAASVGDAAVSAAYQQQCDTFQNAWQGSR